jgi:hypothetical protein
MSTGPGPSNGSAPNGAAGTAPAFDISAIKADLAPKDEPIDLPELGDQPSEDEMLNYAKAHPVVRSAMRVFRAKIVDVKKN